MCPLKNDSLPRKFGKFSFFYLFCTFGTLNKAIIGTLISVKKISGSKILPSFVSFGGHMRSHWEIKFRLDYTKLLKERPVLPTHSNIRF